MTDCAIWARVSTDDQHTANQLDELRKWAQKRELNVVAEFITEDSAWQNGNGSKGKEFDAERAKLLSGARSGDYGARSGDYTVCLVWAVDRLSRRGIEDTLAALRRLTEAGCVVWSHQEPWAEDLKDPHMRELFLAIAAWMAKMESDRRSARVKAALARRKAAGLPVGRQPGAVDKGSRKRSGYVKAWEPGGRRRRAQGS